MTFDISAEERAQIKKSSDVYRLLQKRLRKKRESPYAILGEMEKYLSWFIPIISSLFFILIAASFRIEGVTAFESHWSSTLGFVLFFLSLVSAILSRFFIFHFNKMRSDFTVRLEEWAMKFADLGESLVGRMEQLGYNTSMVANNEEQPSEIWDDAAIQQKAEEGVALFSHDMLCAIINKKLVKQIDALADTKEQKELIVREREKFIKITSMKAGCGRWSIVSFYICNMLFLGSLVAWFIYVLESW